MKKIRHFDALYVGLVVILSGFPSMTYALSLVDGGLHTIDYAVTDGLDIENGTTVTLESGANISDTISPPDFAIHLQGSTLNIHGGSVQGGIYADFANTVEITGGSINGNFQAWGSTVTISGGTIDTIYSEAISDLAISGGTFGNITTISGSYDITGGTFLGALNIGYDLSATMNIKGGNFTANFSYSGGDPFNSPVDNFIFYGDLTLDTPTLISENNGNVIYQTMLSGTLMDGTAISQSITCTTPVGYDDPCGGVAIVNTIPVAPALYLFGSGLLGLIGIARRKKAS